MVIVTNVIGRRVSTANTKNCNWSRSIKGNKQTLLLKQINKYEVIKLKTFYLTRFLL